MNLASKIDRFLRDGYPVPTDAPEGVALPRATAVQLIHVLDGSKLAIRRIEVWRMESWGPMPTDEKWSCARLPLEAAPDYARRSRRAAVSFLKTQREVGAAIYAIDIDEQQEAA